MHQFNAADFCSELRVCGFRGYISNCFYFVPHLSNFFASVVLCLLKVQNVYFSAVVCFSFSCTRLLHTYTQLCCCCHCLQHKPFTAVICNWHLEQYPFFTNLLQQYSYLDSKFVLFRHMCYKLILNPCSKFYKVILHLWRIGFAFIQWKTS